ncbi:MAG: lipopolysaccharide kinase InaA family protein [Marinifilaceae bacterium]
MIKFEINPKYKHLEQKLLSIPTTFDNIGTVIQDNRNIIKVIEMDGLQLNVKSFKQPHIINRFAYTYIRKSKALRSFQYANKLIANNLSTPEPVAYIEVRNGLLSHSYYISIQEDVDMEFRALKDTDADIEPVLRACTRFVHSLHQANIMFIDLSPGNILIKRNGNNDYRFYLVDLNRMNFKDISIKKRIANFRKLMATPKMLHIMADEFAKLHHLDACNVYEQMQKWTTCHNERRFICRFLD